VIRGQTGKLFLKGLVALRSRARDDKKGRRSGGRPGPNVQLKRSVEWGNLGAREDCQG